MPTSPSPDRRPESLELAGWERGRDQLEMTFAIGGERFRKRYRWPDVDLPALEAEYGRERLERLYFHLVAFEAIPMASLRPRRVDFGPLGRFATPELDELWRRILRGVGAQWRWKNRLGDEAGPAWALSASPSPSSSLPSGSLAADKSPGDELLFFNGGGKDSLVAMRLLERAGLPYAGVGYSHTSYGAEDLQRELIAGLGAACRPLRRHHWHVEDELWDDPEATARAFGVEGLIVAETPISIFAALPLALQNGYGSIVLGNERSADDGNFRWAETGEVVNHQWGKSLEAERLVSDYVGRHLLPGVSYWSVLKPLSDVLIFSLLRREGPAARLAHSCSVRKPWCETCPKCAYVGASYYAYLREDQVDGLFSGNLLDHEANQEHYRGLLGLGRPKPFECVGEVDETRLAFQLCRARGLCGRALEMWTREAPAFDHRAATARYLRVATDRAAIPARFAAALEPEFRAAAEAARRYLTTQLEPSVA